MAYSPQTLDGLAASLSDLGRRTPEEAATEILCAISRAYQMGLRDAEEAIRLKVEGARTEIGATSLEADDLAHDYSGLVAAGIARPAMAAE